MSQTGFGLGRSQEPTATFMPELPYKKTVHETHVLILFESTTFDIIQSQLRLSYVCFVHLDFNTVV